MVLEAAAYAVALRKNWEKFRPEFIERLKQLDVAENTIDKVPETLTKVTLVCAAPAGFWIDWLPVTAKGNIALSSWQGFNCLLKAFENAKLPVTFVSISGDVCTPGSLAAQPLSNFPLLSLPDSIRDIEDESAE
jgi:hypothetical protein